MASHDAESRANTREKLRTLMPETTKIFIETHFNKPESYDMYLEIVDGRIDGATRSTTDTDDSETSTDLNQKLRAISKAEIFSKLDRKNQRLLAFSSNWFKADPGQVVFRDGEMADAAYLCVKGKAALHWPDRDAHPDPISVIEPGRLIGDLAVILSQPRTLDLETIEETLFLRIGQTELRAVIESDAKVATSLLETVSGYLVEAAGTMQRLHEEKEALRKEMEKVH